MSEVAEHFVYLGMQATGIAGSTLLTREIGQSVAGGAILAGLDLDGQKHLLVPVIEPDIAEDTSSQGVTLGSRVLLLGRRAVAYADVHCRIPELDLVFERLLDDILARLASDDTAPVESCRQALDDWRTLLRSAGQGIDRETVVGLVAELEVLRLIGSRSPAAALDVWRGPAKAVHDFVRGGSELEVKATASVDGQMIRVSNIDQLDPSLVEKLHLVVLHLRADETAPTLDTRIDELVRLGVPRGELISRVASAGYVYESAPGLDDRYSVRSVRAWLVDIEFPGLRKEDIPDKRMQGITDVKYNLNVGAVPRPLTNDALQALLSDWTRSNE